MKEDEIKEFAEKLAKNLESPTDLSNLTSQLVKMTVEAALGAEMEAHLGYAKDERSDNSNARNGYSKKILKGNHGEVQISTPRDREGSYNPILVGKRQTRLTEFDDQIISLYARGMSTRDIADAFEDMYGAKVSHSLIAQVTDAVIEQVEAWQSRSLDDIYPIIYLDCIVVKVRQDNRVINKSIYVALGVNMDGYKDVLGLWISENEGAKFWLSVLDNLKLRGVKDVVVVCVDGLTGFPDAIASVYPKAKVQLCIVHMIRNSLKYVSFKDRKAVCQDLKRIYTAVDENSGLKALDEFAKKWNDKYAAIAPMWERHWENLRTLFEYPDEIRKVIYTTNAIESLNSVIRKAIKNRRIFPTEASAMKTVFLAINNASKKWTKPIQNWKPALNRFVIEFNERLNHNV